MHFQVVLELFDSLPLASKNHCFAAIHTKNAPSKIPEMLKPSDEAAWNGDLTTALNQLVAQEGRENSQLNHVSAPSSSHLKS